MKTAEEFTSPVKDRPLRITVEIHVFPDELQRAIGEYDWSARLDDVKKSELAKRVSIGSDTNQVFEKVFSEKALSPDKRSPLFNATEWIAAREPSSAEKVSEHNSNVKIEIVEKSKVAAPELTTKVAVSGPAQQPKKQKLPPRKATVVRKVSRPPVYQTSKKMVPDLPIAVTVRIGQGFDLPTKAGILQLDHFVQPFSAEPFFELLIVHAPSVTNLPLQFLLETLPLHPDLYFASPICDQDNKWNYTATLVVPENVISDDSSESLSSHMLIGRLMDYRRLSASKPMGVFALRLDSIDVLVNPAKSVDKFITITSADPIAFDTSKTKVKMAISLIGHEKEVTSVVKDAAEEEIIEQVEEDQSRQDTMEEVSETASLKSESPVVTGPRVEIAPLPFSMEPLQTDVSAGNLNPFQRAHLKAKTRIRTGDFSPIHYQQYTLRENNN